MLIKLLFNSGLDDRGQLLLAGKTFDVTKELADELLRKGRAIIPVPSKPPVETTVAPPLENTALRMTKPPPRKYHK